MDTKEPKKPTNITCDCGCGQVVAKDYGDRIEIATKAHGRIHITTVRL